MDVGPGQPRAPRYRVSRLLPWLPTYTAVALLVGLLVFALVSLRPSEPRRSAPPVPTVATPPFLAGPAPPPPPPPPTPAPPARTASPAPPARTASPSPRPPDVTGRYRVVDTFRDSFIGEVRVANGASRSRTWTVRLRFSPVDTLRTFWVEGAPRPALARSGDTFTFTGAAPVAAGKAAALRFHFDREGPLPTLTACTVNGTGCTLTTAS